MILQAEWSLYQCEKFLQNKLCGKTLIGEVEVDEQDVRKLGALIGREIEAAVASSAKDRVPQVWRQWPCCAACFTVGVFAHCYAASEEDSPSFWPHINELSGVSLSTGQQNMWRMWFEGFLRRRDMQTFERVPGPRMVKRVRIHAVLTSEGAKRVFEHVVEPAVQRGLDQEELSAENMLRELSVKSPPLRKPEYHFLLYGEGVADDILKRCCELYRAAADGDEVAQWSGLPERVIRAFDEWRVGRRLTRGAVQRARRPYLRLDDYGDVVMVLPPLPVSPKVDTVTATVVPVLDGSRAGDPVEVELTIDRHIGATAEVNDVELDVPASEYLVEWSAFDTDGNEHTLKKDHVYGLRDAEKVPWMAFRADDEQWRYVATRTVPRGEVWLLHPPGVPVKGIRFSSGEGLAEPHPQPVPKVQEAEATLWPDFEIARYATEGFAELRIGSGEREAYVPVDLAPRIVLDAQVKGTEVEGTPVVAAPPVVDAAGAHELVAFVRRIEPDTGEELLRLSIDELSQALAGQAGLFEMWVRGRLGVRSRTMRFALIPDVAVRWRRSLYLPGNGEPVEFWLSAAGLVMTGKVEGASRVRPEAGSFRITAPPDARRIVLYAKIQPSNGSPWETALELTVPRVWAGIGRERTPVLGTQRVRVDTASLRSGRELYLWLAVQPTPTRIEAEVVLAPLGRTSALQGRGKGKINLRRWHDELVQQNHNQAIILRATIDGEQFEGIPLGEIVLLPRLKRLTPKADLDGIEVSYRLEGPEVPCTIQIVHLDYPWLSVQRVQVEASDRRGTFRLPPELPPGQCLFWIVDHGAPHQQGPAAEWLSETVQISTLPPPLGGKLTGAVKVHRFDEFLATKVGAVWADVWNRGAAFDSDAALRASAEMARLARAKVTVPHDGWNKVASLALWWWLQARATGQPTALVYAKLAVRRLVQLFVISRHEGQRLVAALQHLKARVTPTTRPAMDELIEFVHWIAS